MLQGIKDAGVGLEDVEYILTTHEHIEHFGGNREIKEKTGAEVCAHSAAADSIEHFHESVLELGRLVEKMEIPRVEKEMLKMAIRANIMVKTVKVDRRLEDGDTVNLGSRELRVIHTPGHSSGHCCFFLRAEGVLFTGDHILGTGTSIIVPPDGDMESYMASLTHLLSCPVKIICPGHGPIVWNAREKIDEYIEHRREREEAILACVRSGIRRTEDLVTAIYTDIPKSFHGMAYFSVEAHLVKLIREGKVRRTEGGEGCEPA